MDNLLPEKILNGSTRSYTISHLLHGTPVSPTIPSERVVMNRVLPPWQRPFVWERERQIAFVEGICLGLGTGSYCVNGSDYELAGEERFMSGWVIDGQQRLTSLGLFLKDAFPVFGSVYYSQLSVAEQRRRILNQPFPCFELEYQADEEKLKELYKRLNFGGVAHTQSDFERLNEK